MKRTLARAMTGILGVACYTILIPTLALMFLTDVLCSFQEASDTYAHTGRWNWRWVKVDSYPGENVVRFGAKR
jgi:hypothetical protein